MWEEPRAPIIGWKNFTKLPFGVLGGVRDMERYIDAERILKREPADFGTGGTQSGGSSCFNIGKDFPIEI